MGKHKRRHRDSEKHSDETITNTDNIGSNGKFWLVGIMVLLSIAFVAGYKLADHTQQRIGDDIKEQQTEFMKELKTYLTDSN